MINYFFFFTVISQNIFYCPIPRDEQMEALISNLVT